MGTVTTAASVGRAERGLDARAWVVWTLAAALLAMLTRNPLYILLVLLSARLVAVVWAPADAALKLPLARLALVVLTFSTLFNGLFVHLGATVLLTLPPDWPLVGGPITLEAAVYGASNGLMLLTLLLIFLAFNNIVTGSDLVHLAPRAFQSLGLVVLIALTYLPETRRHWQKIREAQAIRGHQIQDWRDWRPVLIPLLVGGLERAMSLAEAMVARGYGATTGSGQPLLVQGLLLLGLGTAFAGWSLSYWLGWPGWVLMGLGVVILLLLVWFLGQRVVSRRYEGRRWTWRETLVVLSALLPVLVLLVPWPFVDQSSLYYSPYPRASLPPFDLPAGLALLSLALPGVVGRD